MSLYKKNIDYIKKNNQEMYHNITEKLSKIKEKDDCLELCKDKKGRVNIKIHENTRQYYLHSSYDILKESERWCNSVDTNANLIVVMGLGLGYHIKTLLSKMGPNANLCIIEPDMRIFKYFLQNVDVSQIFDSRVTLLLNDDVKETGYELFTIFSKYIMEKLEIKVYSGYYVKYDGFMKAIEDEMIALIHNLEVNIATSDYFRYLWAMNVLINNRNITGAASGNGLYQKFKGMPAIIVSAGPSLDKNVKQLEALKDKAVIIAGGSSIGILNRNNIKPHFMVAIDGDPEEKDIFEGIDFTDIALIYINRLFFEIVNEYKEKRFLFLDNDDTISKYFLGTFECDYVDIPSSQTVAGINIDLACFLGCDPILFVGQDLAYTNLQMHAEGAAHMVNFEKSLKENPNKFIEINDIEGRETYTIKQFLTTRKGMQYKMDKYKKSNISFYNCTEGGIGFENIPNLSLNEATSKMLKEHFEIDETIDRCHQDGIIPMTEDKVQHFFHDLIVKNENLLVLVRKRYDAVEEIISMLQSNTVDYKRYANKAQEVNECEEALEGNEYYRKIVVGSISHILKMHKAIMEKKLRETEDEKQMNIIKCKSIMNQSAEILGFCNFINNIKKYFE